MTIPFRLSRPTPRSLAPALALVTAIVASGCSDDDDPTGPDTTIDYVQEDRFGLPAVATVFIATDQKDAYNTATPAGDRATYKPAVVAKLVAFGQTAAAADQLANALTPDIQPVNTAQPTAFLNGRRPQDDVITAELGLIFGANAALNDDHVDANDKPFAATFPYLAEPFTQ